MNEEFKQLEEKIASEFVWTGKCDKYIGTALSNIKFKKEGIQIHIEVSLSIFIKRIIVRCNVPTTFEKIFNYFGSVRRYEYLFDGTFYQTESSCIDGVDITEIIKKYEVGYFRYSRTSYRIQLELTDKDYTRGFRQWLVLEKQLGIINQMMLYANNIPDLTADLRLAMMSEVYEPLAKYLEKKKIINIQREPAITRKVECNNCQNTVAIKISGKKTFSSCLLAILDKYGKPIFKTEFRRRKSLIKRIVKTRNKMFHVNKKQKEVLKGYNSGFYVIKMELLYRYILLLLIGIEQGKMDESVSEIINKMEYKFSDGIYK